VTLSFPSGRTAEEVVVDDAAGLAWIVNLGCIELHPHAVRSGDLEHPDELRVDLDPGPGVPWADVRRVALEVQSLLSEVGLRGWPKTSGSRGMHVNVRIEQRWTFSEVRRAAIALSRAVERRAPSIATSKWWKEERHGVFLDYNQNAKDRTTCSAYSVRPTADARVSMPLHWNEVADSEPEEFTVLTVPKRLKDSGDPHAGMDDAAGSLEGLLELAAKDDAAGLGDARGRRTFERWKASRRGSLLRAHGLRRRKRLPRKRCHSLSWRTHPTSRPLSTVSNDGNSAIRMRRSTSQSRMYWSIRCAADRPPGAASASICATCPSPSDLSRRRRTPTTIPRANGVAEKGSASAMRRKDRGEFLRRYYFELRIRAIGWALIVTPSTELRGVPESIALHVVIRDLHNEFRPQRLP
jgi:DNA ligase D-like protein (predicted polymerase)